MVGFCLMVELYRKGLRLQPAQQTCSNTHVCITRPTTYEKSKQSYFGKNIVRVRPHLDTLIGVPNRYKNVSLDRNDYCNLVSDFVLEVHSAIERPFPAAPAASAGLWTEPQIPAEIVFFLTFRPVYLFLKLKISKKIVFFFKSLNQTFFSGFSCPIFVRKKI